MDGHRHKAGRRRRRKSRAESRSSVEPVLIVARRPNSPFLPRTGRLVAASAAPAPERVPEPIPLPKTPRDEKQDETPRRAARIVRLPTGELGEREERQKRLLRRLMQSDGRGAISRAADEYLTEGFELPDQQEVHLQLLEHFDEERARNSLEAMTRLLKAEEPIKRPVLDQRLRRLEEYAEDPSTRTMAAALRRTLRG